MSKNKDLEVALQLLKGSHLEFLGNETPQCDISAQPQGKSNNSALFCIPDFVTKPNASTANSDRDKVKRVEEVTTAQWISANAKILLKLMADGVDRDEIQRYLRYTVKVGDYLQMAETSSVMLLDNEHRRQVYEENRQWDNIDSDKVYFHLKTHSFFKSKGKQPATDDRGKQICLRFNKGHCYMTYCKYSHVCLLCKGDHPRHQHQQGPQNGGQNAPAVDPQVPPPRFRPF